jgi:hypothetical protein
MRNDAIAFFYDAAHDIFSAAAYRKDAAPLSVLQIEAPDWRGQSAR